MPERVVDVSCVVAACLSARSYSCRQLALSVVINCSAFTVSSASAAGLALPAYEPAWARYRDCSRLRPSPVTRDPDQPTDESGDQATLAYGHGRRGLRHDCVAATRSGRTERRDLSGITATARMSPGRPVPRAGVPSPRISRGLSTISASWSASPRRPGADSSRWQYVAVFEILSRSVARRSNWRYRWSVRGDAVGPAQE